MKVWLYHPNGLPIQVNTWERKEYPEWVETPFKPDPPDPSPTIEEVREEEKSKTEYKIRKALEGYDDLTDVKVFVDGKRIKASEWLLQHSK